jgi:hypothetical protein
MASLVSKTTVFDTSFSLLIEQVSLGTDRLFQNSCQKHRFTNGANVRITAQSAGYKPICYLKAGVLLGIEARTASQKNYCATWAFCCMLCFMHPRNSEILGPVIRAYGSKNREQAEKPRPTDAPRRDENPSPPRQLSLLDK